MASTLKLKVFGTVIIAGFVVGIVHNFLTHPFSNKKIVEFAKNDWMNNRSHYDRLTSFFNGVETKYPDFELSNPPKGGFTYNALGPFEEDSSFVSDTIIHDYKFLKFYDISFPPKKELDFKIPYFVEGEIDQLGIKFIRVKYRGAIPYATFYKPRLNHSMNGKVVYLYYFPEGYPEGYFNEDRKLFESPEGDDWLYRLNENWIIKSSAKK